ncbi:MAG TPA: acyl carrier protein [Nitrococcus sp.]|nr:acyl carrier protein [Nitrococcus sp.]
MDTFERLKKILVNKFEVEEPLVVPEATPESLGLDSLDFIEVLFELEDEFGVRIGNDARDRPKMDTLADVARSLDTLVAEQGASAILGPASS